MVGGHQPKKDFHNLMEQSFGHKILIEHIQVAAGCQLEKSFCSKQDIVLFLPFQAMEILAIISYKTNAYALGQLLHFAEDAEDAGACLWHETEGKCLVLANDILCPLVYNKDKNQIKTLVPWQVRLHLKKHRSH